MVNKLIANKLFLGFVFTWLVLVTYTAGRIVISEDEAYSLATTSQTVPDVIHTAYVFEGQPPFYFLVLSFWRKLNTSIFFAKLFSVTCILASTWYFYQLILLFSGKYLSKWILLIYLFTPYTVWAALEIRGYALLIFLSTAASYHFFKYFFEEKKRHLLFFIVVSSIGILTQYFFAFIIVAFTLIMLTSKGWKATFRFCLALIPLLLSLFPSLFFLNDQIADHQSLAKYTLSSIENLLKAPQNLLLSINHIPSVLYNRPIRIVFIVVYVFSFYQLYKRLGPQSSTFKKYSLLLIFLTVIVILFSISILMTGIKYDDRYMSIAFPIVLLLLTIFKVLNRRAVQLVFAAILFLNFFVLKKHYTKPVNTYDYQAIANFIESIEKPGEPLLLYRPAIALPLSYYYKGINATHPLPYAVSFDSSYLINIKDSFQLKKVIESIPSKEGSYFFISDTTHIEGNLNMNRNLVTKYLKNNYIIIFDTLFFGDAKYEPLRIRKIVRKKNDK